MKSILSVFILFSLLFSQFGFSAPKLNPHTSDDYEEEEVAQDCEPILAGEDLPLLKIGHTEISSFDADFLAKNFSRKERKLIAQMKESYLFDSWENVPANEPLKIPGGYSITKLSGTALDVPSFIFEGKKYLITEPSVASTKSLTYQTAPKSKAVPKVKDKNKTLENIKNSYTKVKNKISRRAVIATLALGTIAGIGYVEAEPIKSKLHEMKLAHEERVRQDQIAHEERAKQYKADRELQNKSIDQQFPLSKEKEPKVQEVLKLATATSDYDNRDKILIEYADQNLGKLNPSQIIELATHTADYDNRDKLLVEYAKENADIISTDQILELSKHAANYENRDIIIGLKKL